jgi:uncharacterized membrane protein
MQPLKSQTLVSGIVWIVCGFIVVLARVTLLARSASVFWEYVGGLMILFGLVRLFWGLLRGGKNTKPGFWSRII